MAAEIIEAGIEDLGFDSFMVEEPVLNAFIPKDLLSLPNLKTVLSGFSDWKLSYTTELIPEQNWNAVWESDFEPVVVDGVVTVKAVYHKDLPLTKYNIVINPEMSFGSGHHQTTCMMIESLLEEGSLKGRAVLDMGCGTGILAIMAAKLGAGACRHRDGSLSGTPVHAVDIDPVCVRSSEANARRNHVGHKMVIRRGDAGILQKGSYDLVLANINRNILLSDMSSYVRAFRPSGGTLVISGFYEEDVPMLVERAAELGLKLTGHRTRDNWSCLKFTK